MSEQNNLLDPKEDTNIYTVKGKKYKRVMSKWRGYAGSWHYTWKLVAIDENVLQKK
jgi:hypothetical protein